MQVYGYYRIAIVCKNGIKVTEMGSTEMDGVIRPSIFSDGSVIMGLSAVNKKAVSRLQYWEVGDLSLMSVVGMVGIAGPVVLLFFPVAMRKLGSMKLTNSPYGMIASAWKIEKGKTFYEFTVPANTKAVIELEVKKEEAERLDREIPEVIHKEGIISFEVGSGTYLYTVNS